MLYYQLGLDDIILPTDEVRSTVINTGWGDSPLNREEVETWGKATNRLSGWIGSTLRQYNDGEECRPDIEVRRVLSPKKLRTLPPHLVNRLYRALEQLCQQK